MRGGLAKGDWIPKRQIKIEQAGATETRESWQDLQVVGAIAGLRHAFFGYGYVDEFAGARIGRSIPTSRGGVNAHTDQDGVGRAHGNVRQYLWLGFHD